MNGVVSTHITDMIARAVSLDVLERQLGRKPAGDENHAQSKTWHLCCNTRVHGATASLANHSVSNTDLRTCSWLLGLVV